MGFAAFRQRHQAEVQKRRQHHARQVSAKTADSAYVVWRDQCRNDWSTVKAPGTDHAERDQVKAQKLKVYRDYLQNWIDSGETHSNEVLVINLIWAGDCQQWDWFMTLLAAVRDTQQAMPSVTGFKSDPLTAAADIVFQKAETAFKADNSVIEPWLLVFDDIHAGDWPLNTSLKARYYKLAGEMAEQEPDNETALDYYQQADQLKADIGVKGRIKRLDKLPSPQANG